MKYLQAQPVPGTDQTMMVIETTNARLCVDKIRRVRCEMPCIAGVQFRGMLVRVIFGGQVANPQGMFDILCQKVARVAS